MLHLKQAPQHLGQQVLPCMMAVRGIPLPCMMAVLAQIGFPATLAQ